MNEAVDQIFVSLKHWLVELVPVGWRGLTSIILSIVPAFVVFPGLFALVTVVERKTLGRIQNRYGPNRVGPFGILQFAADGLKTLTKEDIVPRNADRVVHFLAPLALVLPTFLVYAVLPFGRGLTMLDLDCGLLFFFAVGATTEMSVFMAGWSSRNKYALFGAMRAIAQMISYEIPLILSAITVVMIAGTLSLTKIVEAQGTFGGWLPDWYVFTPWGLAGFILFFICAAAESNRSPFDLPEGESEIIAGYYIEYSGFKFALFFLGEYLGLFAICSLGITLFLGGWNAPARMLEFIPSYAWYFIKLLALIMLFIWIRGTLPRLRQDQLMNFAWKFMIPLALINLVVAALWHFVPEGFTRWFVCSVIIIGSYLVLGRGALAGRPVVKRIYRYAD